MVNPRDYINTLDLSYIVEFMCSERYPLPVWERDDALECMKLYKRFLLLISLYPKGSLVPTKEIDEFWHNHILYTKQYHQDCNNLGFDYLHHAPAEGDGSDDESLVEGFERTQALYLKEFGEPLAVFESVAS